MYIIGENIHIISDKVKEALTARDSEFFMDLAVKQVEAGAKAVDINLGPRKKDWAEVFPWIVQAVEQVVDVPLSIDTTNIDGMEAALKTADVLQKAVIAQKQPGEGLENSHGLSIYLTADGIPTSYEEKSNRLSANPKEAYLNLSLSQKTRWDEFLQWVGADVK